MLETGFIDPNDRSQACKISGFLPIHAVVANGERATASTIAWLRVPRVSPCQAAVSVDMLAATGQLQAVSNGASSILHPLVTAGLMSMYDWVTEELPEARAGLAAEGGGKEGLAPGVHLSLGHLALLRMHPRPRLVHCAEAAKGAKHAVA